MRSRILGLLILICGAGFTSPILTHAGIFDAFPGRCCDHCSAPMAQCQCAAPVAPPMVTQCTETRAVVRTHLRAEQVTTFRDVPETTMQAQTCVENVPQTTFKNVTVDEGGYQMVWVPKPVTKQVAQTTVTQQVKTRMVPVTTMRRVPQVSTRMVPVQTVEHVTTAVPTFVAAPIMPTMTAACDTCGPIAMTAFASPVFGTPVLSANPIPVLTSPTVMGTPVFVPTVPQTAINPPADLRAPMGSPSANNSVDKYGDYQPIGPSGSLKSETPRSLERKADADPAHAPRTSSLFQAAPSAAHVWNARIGTYR